MAENAQQTPEQASVTPSAEVTRVLGRLDELSSELWGAMESRDEEIKEVGQASEETGRRVSDLVKSVDEVRADLAEASKVSDEYERLRDRVREIEAQGGRPGLGGGNAETVDVPQAVLEHENYRNMIERNAKRSDPISVPIAALMRPAWSPRADVLTTSQNPDLWLPQRIEESPVPRRPLRVRDLIGVRQMTEGTISYVREIGFTGPTASVDSITQTSGVATATVSAGHGVHDGDRVRIAGADQSEYNGIHVVRYATDTTFTFTVDSGATTPATGTLTYQNLQSYGVAEPTAEGSALPEAIFETETIEQRPKRIGHWIPVTKATLRDDAQMRDRLETRIPYGILFAEEGQILFGDGTGENLTGLATDSSVQTYAWSEGESGDTRIDAIRRAMTLTSIAEFPATGVVLSEQDWELIETTKGTDNHYILFREIGEGGRPRIWRVPLVVSHKMPPGKFLAGAFGMVSRLWQREDAELMVADQHSDYAIRGQVAMIAEEWVVLQNERPEAFVYGDFDSAPA